MPHNNEKAGRTGQVGILAEIDGLRDAYFKNARTHQGGKHSVALQVRDRFIPYPDSLVVDVDTCAGLDGSTYEGAFDEHDPQLGGYPSARVAITQISHRSVDVGILWQLNQDANRGACINPHKVASALGGVGALDFWFCSSNMIPQGAASAQDGFRAALCNALRKPQARLPSCDNDAEAPKGWTLLAAYHLLLHRLSGMGLLDSRSLAFKDGVLVATTCPACNEERGRSGNKKLLRPAVALDPDRKVNQEAKCPSRHTLSELDLLGFPGDFSAEMPNYNVFHTFGMLVEQLRALQILLAQTNRRPPGAASVEPWPTPPAKIGVLVDGPVGLFKRSGVLVPALRSLIDDLIGLESSQAGQQGLVFGVIKQGVVKDFLVAVEARARRAGKDIPKGSFWLVDGASRAKWIMRQKRRELDTGPQTYAGHEIAVKTHQGKLFLLSVPLPMPTDLDKRPNERDADFLERRFARARELLHDPYSAQRHYLHRVLALLEGVQSALFGASTVPQVVAHSHASLSWHPSGDALMASIRKARRGDT